MLSKIVKASYNVQRISQIMAVQPQRYFLKDLGLDSTAIATRDAAGSKAGEVNLWKE
jgi:hypothetical protein